MTAPDRRTALRTLQDKYEDFHWKTRWRIVDNRWTRGGTAIVPSFGVGTLVVYQGPLVHTPREGLGWQDLIGVHQGQLHFKENHG